MPQTGGTPRLELSREPSKILAARFQTPLAKAKCIAEQAMKARKVFRLDGGHRYIRQALLSRGWVEKITPRTKRFEIGERSPPSGSDDDQSTDDDSDESDDDLDTLVSGWLRDYEPNIQFMPHHRIAFDRVNRYTVLNHFPKTRFITKTGLTSSLHGLSWVTDRHSEDFYPRCYILGDAEDNQVFRDEFRRCAILSFLKLCSAQLDLALDENCPSISSKIVESEWIQFALEMFDKHYNRSVQASSSTIIRQINLDNEGENETKRWETFIKHFYNVAYKAYFVQGVPAYESSIRDVLKQDQETNPQSFIEGDKNLWIIKPGAMSRGRGVGVYNNLKQIIDLLGHDLNVIANNKWVAQKYIERPFLIYGVKFDIRQWFVVTDWNQLSIWMYKRSYVRFATTRFTLDRLDRQTHLTNNAIQRNFDFDDDVHEDIPDEKMWFSEDFDNYLQELGHGNIWEEQIVPEFRRILIDTCLSSQDSSESRKNTFEIYGADFMLDAQLNPWLIEINQGPTMATSTTVSNELVSLFIEDLCKVVLDRNLGPSRDVGDFDHIYRQQLVPIPRYIGNALTIEGKGLIKPKQTRRRFVKTPSLSGTPDTKTYGWDIDRINRLAQPRCSPKKTCSENIQPESGNEAVNESSPSISKLIEPVANIVAKYANQRNRQKRKTKAYRDCYMAQFP